MDGICYLSFISEMELLAFPGITEDERNTVRSFIADTVVIDLNDSIKRLTIDLRIQYKLKIPDAIIAATAFYLNIPLISADKAFERIVELQFLKYEV